MVSTGAQDAVNVLATIASGCIFISMIPEYYGVYKQRSTANKNFYPLLAMFAQCIGWSLYGWASGSYFPVGAVNTFGAVMTLGYWAVFLSFEQERRRSYLMYLVVDVVAMLALSLYGFLSPQDHDDIADVMGYLSNAGAIIMFASPLLTLRKVIAAKNSEILSLGMALSGCVNGALWSAYGIMKSDTYVLVPNFISSCLCVIQLVFIAIFHQGKSAIPSPTTSDKKESLVAEQA